MYFLLLAKIMELAHLDDFHFVFKISNAFLL